MGRNGLRAFNDVLQRTRLLRFWTPACNSIPLIFKLLSQNLFAFMLSLEAAAIDVLYGNTVYVPNAAWYSGGQVTSAS